MNPGSRREPDRNALCQWTDALLRGTRVDNPGARSAGQCWNAMRGSPIRRSLSTEASAIKEALPSVSQRDRREVGVG
jgi:hypothetical protein